MIGGLITSPGQGPYEENIGVYGDIGVYKDL